MSADNGSGLYGRDTLSRCDTYSNPYDLRFDADLARKRLGEKNLSAGPDELEGDSARLERLLVEKFQKNQFNILKSEKMGAVITGGKFVLLAFVMPAYLFFYGLPRWMFQHAFPPVAALAAQAAEMVQGIARFAVQFTQNIFTAITNKAENLIGWNKGEDAKNSRGFIHWTFHTAKTEMENKVKSVKERINDAYNTLMKAFAGAYHFLADPVINAVQERIDGLVNTYNGIKSTLEKSVNFVKEKVQERVEQITEKFHNFIEATKHVFLAPIKFAVNTYQTVFQRTGDVYHKVVETANDLRNWTLAKTKEITHEVVRAVKERAQEVVHGVQRAGEVIAAPFIASAVWIQGQAVNLLAMGKEWMTYGSEASKKSLVWFLTKGLPKLAEKILPKWLNPIYLWKEGQRWKESFAQGFKKFKMAIRQKIVEKINVARGKIDQVFRSILKVLNWIWSALKGAALRFYKKRLKVVLSYLTPNAIANGFKNTLTFFRVLFRIAKRMSQELLSDLTN